jgi:hypothetical protein
MIALFAIVQTLCDNFKSVQRVRFILNGQPAETLAGHIAIDHSLRPLPWLLNKPSNTAR